jgi:APA family basic amino acid/polyamine antiporter
VVSQGWSSYANLLLNDLGIHLPDVLAPRTTDNPSGQFNLLAFLLIAVLTALVAWGIKESLRVNLVLVGIKLFVVLFVIFAGIAFINTANYHPFIPPAKAGASASGLTQPLIQAMFGFTPTTYGIGGIFAGASIVFFAYIGFDVVATTAEEAKHPQRDLPIGIIASLVVCTILYVAVAAVITGMVKYDKIDPDAALATAFKDVGKSGYATIIACGAVAGLTTVVMTLIIGATRVLFAMCRDWLLPPDLARTNPRTGTPVRITIMVGLIVAVIGAWIGNHVDLEEMVNIRTLAAFTLVSIAVPILRRRRPDLKRAFTVPFSPWLPIAAALASLYLMLNLSVETWIRFLIWMVIGFVVYASYGYRRSRLAAQARDDEVPSLTRA